MKILALIPTYNNADTIADVVHRTVAAMVRLSDEAGLSHNEQEDKVGSAEGSVSDTTSNGVKSAEVPQRKPKGVSVLVVNDGSTDNTPALLEKLQAECDALQVLSYDINRGKGYALSRGLQQARQQGYDYAVTLDADGQHYPEDIPLLLQPLRTVADEGRLVVGSRNLNADNMPAGNSFANRFSNFWFFLQTGHHLPDTQTGFRVYDLHYLPHIHFITRRYESELELLVFSAWRGVRLIPVPVRVCYPPERVSHFRPFWDFFRISLLNALLCVAALLYGYPAQLCRRIKKSLKSH